MAECNGCGSCCDPVILPHSLAATLMATDERSRRWLLEDLSPMSRGAAKLLEPWLGELANVNFFRCRHYDRATRRCLDYANRPRVCSGYPWYDKTPNRGTYLPPTCSFREDVGLPVKLGPKPLDWRERIGG